MLHQQTIWCARVNLPTHTVAPSVTVGGSEESVVIPGVIIGIDLLSSLCLPGEVIDRSGCSSSLRIVLCIDVSFTEVPDLFLLLGLCTTFLLGMCLSAILD